MALTHLETSGEFSGGGQEIFDFLKERIVGQERALRALVSALDIHNAGLVESKKPIGNFLLLGPSGVGKSYLPEQLAEGLLCDSKAYTKIRCQEYSENHAISRLMGAPPGYVGFLDPDRNSDDKIMTHVYPLLSQYNIDRHDYLGRHNIVNSEVESQHHKLEEERKILYKIVSDLKKRKKTRTAKYRQASDRLKGLVGAILRLKKESGSWLAFENLGPYISIVNFDEIERSSRCLHNVIMDVLDSGVLGLTDGRETYFYNSIIFATSNVGSREITQKLRGQGFGFQRADLADWDENDKRADEELVELVMEAARKKFPPEFLNRFDEMIVFRPLSRQRLLQVLDKEIGYLKERLVNRQVKIDLTVDQPAKDFIVREATTNIEYGARYLKRVLNKFIVRVLSVLINNQKVVAGDKILVVFESGGIVFYKNGFSTPTTTDIK